MRHDKDSLVGALQLADYKVVYVSTKEDEVKGALKEHYDLVVAAGGDGPVGYVFSHLADRSVPIGVMPFGSANHETPDNPVAEDGHVDVVAADKLY
jgi:diacylglycerol kinase (ATP)